MSDSPRAALRLHPSIGSTAAIFPIDDVTIDYLRLTGRPDDQLALVDRQAAQLGGREPAIRCKGSTPHERHRRDLASVAAHLQSGAQ